MTYFKNYRDYYRELKFQHMNMNKNNDRNYHYMKKTLFKKDTVKRNIYIYI